MVHFDQVSLLLTQFVTKAITYHKCPKKKTESSLFLGKNTSSLWFQAFIVRYGFTTVVMLECYHLSYNFSVPQKRQTAVLYHCCSLSRVFQNRLSFKFGRQKGNRKIWWNPPLLELGPQRSRARTFVSDQP